MGEVDLISKDVDKNKFLINVLNTSPNCIYVKDKKGRYLLANKAIADLYQTTPEEMIGKKDIDFAEQAILKPLEADFFVDTDQKAIKTKKKQVIKCEPFTWNDGTIHYFQTTKIPITYGDNPDCVMGVSVDITKQKKIERLNKKIVELSPNAIITLDLNGKINSCNKKAIKILGYSKKEMIGKNFLDVGSKNLKNKQKIKKIFKSILENKQSKNFELEIQRKNKDLLTAEISYSLLKENNKKTGVQIVLSDITDKKENEKNLKKVKED